MVIRVLGVFVGLAALLAAFVSEFEPRSLMFVFIGVAFIAYGIGGQKLLAKIAPHMAEKNDRESR